MGEKIATVVAYAFLGAVGIYIGTGYAVTFGFSKAAGALLGASCFMGLPLAAEENN